MTLGKDHRDVHSFKPYDRSDIFRIKSGEGEEKSVREKGGGAETTKFTVWLKAEMKTLSTRIKTHQFFLT